MLSEEEIKRILHASRVVPISVPNPHGPLGWEHLAHEMERIHSESSLETRPVELPKKIWEKLDQLAKTTSQERTPEVTGTNIAAAILEKTLGLEHTPSGP